MADQNEFVPIPEPDLPFFMLDEWTKVYIGQIDDIGRHLAAAGIETYHVLAIEKRNATSGTTTTVVRTPQIFYVTETICYRTQVPVGVNTLPFQEIESFAFFSLPKIPAETVMLVEDFFRAVDRKYHTEAIVLLVFNPTKLDAEGNYAGDGWRVLVPEQENTAGHCNYVPESIAGDKLDDEFLVGSIHSHPGMSAFASGTDHSDQAEFNGIHITYGWQSSVNNGATQYHGELQIDGRNWTLTPEQMFAPFEPRVADPVVDNWIEAKVKKALPVANSVTSYSSGGYSTKPTDTHSSYSSGNAMRRNMRLEDIKGLPVDAPKYEDHIYVGRLTSIEEVNCPFCRQPLISHDRTHRRCTACHSYLALPGESVAEVLAARRNEQVYVWDLDPEENPPKPIVLWCRDEADSNFQTVYTPAIEVPGK